MARVTQNSEPNGLGALIGQLTEGLTTLLVQHINLARVELAAEAKEAGAVLGQLALFIPFVLFGYLLLQFALAFGLARWLGPAGGFAVVGALNVLGGAYGLFHMRAYLKRQGRMSGTFKELRRSADWLSGSNPSASPSQGETHVDSRHSV